MHPERVEPSIHVCNDRRGGLFLLVNERTGLGRSGSGARVAVALMATAAVLLMIGLRVLHLHSDPYVRIDWDTGILTDEGFYLHNARNVVLFGRARTDEFNNMLLAPLWHAVQVAVFTVFGVGSLQARGISVVCGLLTVLALFVILRKQYGFPIALIAALLLGLDHVSTLFQRLALLDVPSALLAVAAFGCYVLSARGPHRTAWLASCGALIALTVANRTLCIYLIPVPFAALAASRAKGREYLAVAAGIAAVLVLYTILWYLPNRGELAHMNHYYRTVQVQPRSWHRLLGNIKLAFLGETYGSFSYLFRHTPVPFAFALLTLAAILSTGCRTQGEYRALQNEAVCDGPTVYLAAWVVFAWAELAASNYAPDRYLITMHPALFALAAVALWRLPELARLLGAPGWRATLARAATVWFLGYHALEAVLHRGGVLPPNATYTALYLVPTLAALGAAIWGRWGTAPLSSVHHRLIVAGALGIWVVVNSWWYSDWLGNLEYTQYQFNRWLVRNLPRNSVLLGDVAPGVTMDTPFMAVDVQEGLCNDHKPVERWAKYPTYILLLDWVWKEPYWIKRYPALVAPRRRMRHVRILRWWIGMYPAAHVPHSQGAAPVSEHATEAPPHTRPHRSWMPRG